MNSDIDSTQSSLLWLLLKFDPTFLMTTNMVSKVESSEDKLIESPFGVESDAASSKPSHHHGFESKLIEFQFPYPSTSWSRVVSFTTYNPRLSAASREFSKLPVDARSTESEIASQTAQSFYFGEIHAVQERYHSLLKQRLRSEYEKNPPLFPWETEISEYPAEVSETTGVAVEIAPLWRAHMSKLKVPSLLPQPLLNALFLRCQSLAKQPIKRGIRLVKAVEDIFPDQSDLLEPIADMVLVPAYRSDVATQEALAQQLVAVAGDYDSAHPEQKIALSMLAAQEILGALTLSISAVQSADEKQWLTSHGILNLSATYLDKQLTIKSILPTGGQVRLWDSELEKCASRVQPGVLDLVLTNPKPQKTYLLEVSLQGESTPLNFAIYVADI